jgi:hypothetical protein
VTTTATGGRSTSVTTFEPARGEWITLAECARILGRESNPSAVKSIALAGGIRTRSQPGTRILYSREDAERLSGVPTDG